MKKIILFDIDKTLFDTNHFVKIICNQIAEILNIDFEKCNEEIEVNYLANLKSYLDFDPIQLCKYLSIKYKVSYKSLRNVFYKNTEVYSNSLFPDSLEVLEDLTSSFDLGIFSEGVLQFQKKKIKDSGIINYVYPSYIYIFRRKVNKKVLASLPQNSIIVDDKIEKLEYIKINSTHLPVWINRSSLEDHQSISTIHSLIELVKEL